MSDHESALQRSSAVRAKRIYEKPDRRDGYRVLVDRLWPRGVSRKHARLDEWAPELAPSEELRKWFDHDPERFARFRRRYLAELAPHTERLDQLRRRAAGGPLTILFAARDLDQNNAAVLVELLSGNSTAHSRHIGKQSRSQDADR